MQKLNNFLLPGKSFNIYLFHQPVHTYIVHTNCASQSMAFGGKFMPCFITIQHCTPFTLSPRPSFHCVPPTSWYRRTPAQIHNESFSEFRYYLRLFANPSHTWALSSKVLSTYALRLDYLFVFEILNSFKLESFHKFRQTTNG